jgi:deoxyribonuclease-1
MKKPSQKQIYQTLIKKILPHLRRLPLLWQGVFAVLIVVILLLWLLVESTVPPDKAIDISSLPKTPASFSTAKNLLYGQVYFDNRESFYCGCRYNRDLSVNWESCGYVPRQNNTRAARIEAEHIVPASWIGQNRPCWQKNACQDDHGKSYGGRQCCLDSDPFFQIAHNDLHNLVPAIGEINGDRSNFPFGEIPGEARAYGACDFEVENGRSEPKESIRGDIARIMFYMEETYGLTLPAGQKKVLEQWHRDDPVDEWEKIRNQRIKRLQGNGNRFVAAE